MISQAIQPILEIPDDICQPVADHPRRVEDQVPAWRRHHGVILGRVFPSRATFARFRDTDARVGS